MPLAPGDIIRDRYHIVRIIAQSELRVVYRAWDTSMERSCAVKENLAASAEAKDRFMSEASILFDLSHPNLPKVRDYFVIPGKGQYLVMDFVDGEDLQEILDREKVPLPEEQVLNWISQICGALIYLHNQVPPVVHRDIKPTNIKITPQGKAILVDFGISEVIDSRIPTKEHVKGVSPGYSPPEQYDFFTDVRSDIYAVGATLYHLLTGNRPLASVRFFDVKEVLPHPRELNSNISLEVENAILKCMELDPEKRFQNVVELLDTIIPWTPDGETELPKPRHRIFAGVAIGLFIIIVFTLIIGIHNGWIGNTIFQIASLASPTSGVKMSTPKSIISRTPLPSKSTPTQQQKSLSVGQKSVATPSPIPTNVPMKETILIEPYCSMENKSPITINTKQSVTLWWRWDAKTSQHVEAHIANAIYRIVLDGVEIQSQSMSEIEYLPDKDWYRVSWYAPIGSLTPGKHTAKRYLSWKRLISDGWKTYGPHGDIETEYHWCEIIVLD